ncbi:MULTISPECIES: acetyl-CoA C-acetyltransferase [unclassified Pseudofrankia]|uniref:acetyl-CoA C-acetyltransferase n=1 Tax=unclassified Pseudofrankia TaxID=2994372 RepID=UPI0008DB0141|nr:MULTISPECIES: acetyl-CoA C-acetyltransferase [unclassified Pseudofrankia]MDT3444911.1 acetyl-CoA C-acetyltransferase [Pseudofrankia sp. BMG5.37]OHV64820.1 acetyl-CoA acetyltransferase [Pseudofrankia sp. BMG5.36]
MRDVVVCEPVRTPVGRYGGVFKDVPAAELAAGVVTELVRRAGLTGADVDEVIFGQCYPNGEAPAIGRIAALDAGLPVTVPGLQLDRRCGSGLQAVIDAAMRVQTGICDLVLAGGAESMSQAEHYALGLRFGFKGDSTQLSDRIARGRITSGGRQHPVPGGMLETAENLRQEFGITRAAQDDLALTSHRRAVAAHTEGRFKDEIVPVTVVTRHGETVIDTDEHPRPDITLEALARLRPIRQRLDTEATVTAGNASGQNDGAAACIVTTRERADELGIRPLARLVTWGAAGVEPARMGIGPVPSTEVALRRAGLRLSDIDLIELNEAFAAQVLAVTTTWGLTDSDFDRLNVNGSGISLGHPVGATGVRILATLLRELDRREQQYALETMCIGGGQGLTAIFERTT